MAMNIPTAAARVMQEFKLDLLKDEAGYPPNWGDFCMEVPSTSKSTLHAWLSNSHVVEEWLGPAVFKNMSSRTWEVTNRKWRYPFEFTRDEIADDLEGLVNRALMAARDGRMAWVDHENSLVASTLEAGISSLCHDGQFFFDTDHPIDPDGVNAGTYDNDLTLALSHANYGTAWETLLGFKGPNNRPLVMPNSLVLVVPPQLASKAKSIVEIGSVTPGASYAAVGTGGASDNIYAGTARVLVNPYLTDTTRWYLGGSRGSLKPLLLQRRQGVEVEEIGPESELWKREHKMQIIAHARHAASYGIPQLMITSKP